MTTTTFEPTVAQQGQIDSLVNTVLAEHPEYDRAMCREISEQLYSLLDEITEDIGVSLTGIKEFPSANIREDLGLDSMAHLEVYSSLEAKYNFPYTMADEMQGPPDNDNELLIASLVPKNTVAFIYRHITQEK